MGAVVNAGPNLVTSPTGAVTNASFTLVDVKGKPVTDRRQPLTSVTLSALGIPGHLTVGQTPLATFDAQDATPGGGITGSVLISPLIKPGTVSDTSYNHYSWLRTMEDIFQVAKGNSYAPLPAGTVSGGLDRHGSPPVHRRWPRLMPFGTDVFNNAGPMRHGPGCRPSRQSERAG